MFFTFYYKQISISFHIMVHLYAHFDITFIHSFSQGNEKSTSNAEIHFLETNIFWFLVFDP